MEELYLSLCCAPRLRCAALSCDGDGGHQVLSKPGHSMKAIGIAAVTRSGLLNTDLEI